MCDLESLSGGWWPHCDLSQQVFSWYIYIGGEVGLTQVRFLLCLRSELNLLPVYLRPNLLKVNLRLRHILYMST